MKSKNTNNPITQSSFIDCVKTIKEEDIKGEIDEEESVEDPIYIHHYITSHFNHFEILLFYLE